MCRPSRIAPQGEFRVLQRARVLITFAAARNAGRWRKKSVDISAPSAFPGISTLLSLQGDDYQNRVQLKATSYLAIKPDGANRTPTRPGDPIGSAARAVSRFPSPASRTRARLSVGTGAGAARRARA